MIMSNINGTLLNGCCTIQQMEKQQKHSCRDNPKHEAAKSSNAGTRKRGLFDSVFDRDVQTYVKPLRNLTVPPIRARDSMI